MTIATFANRHERPLVLVVEPWGNTYDIPALGEVGIRYALSEGAEDRSYLSVEEDRIEFRCNADGYDVDIVPPSAFDLLCYDICVNGGWCGGLLDDKPISVDDFIPEEGQITASEFARMAIRADGWDESEPFPEKHLRYLEKKFIEHLGAPSAPAEALRRNKTRPFGEATS